MDGSFWIENEEFVTAAIRLSMGAVVPWIFAERQLSGRMMVQLLDGATRNSGISSRRRVRKEAALWRLVRGGSADRTTFDYSIAAQQKPELLAFVKGLSA